MSQKLHTADDLKRVASAGGAALYTNRLQVLIGSSTCGLAMGARAVEDAVVATVKKFSGDAIVKRTGCIGFCSSEPLMDLVLPGGPRISYGNMTPQKARDILTGYLTGGSVSAEEALGKFSGEEHVLTGEVHSYPEMEDAVKIPEWSGLDFFRRQKKVILRNCGMIDPMSIEESIARGSYRGALRALLSMKPEDVLDEMTASGLRGRGGA